MTRFLPFGSRSKTIQVNTLGGSSVPTPPAFQINTDGTLTNSLVAYYKLEDSTDIWAWNNATSTTGMTYTSGKVNNAGTFDGSTSNIQVPWSLFPNATNEFTIGFWLKLNQTATNQMFFGGARWSKWVLGYIAWGNLVFSKPWIVDLSTGYTWWTSTWNYFIFEASQANGMRIFMNNTVIASNANMTNFVTTWDPFTIGNYMNNGSIASSWTVDGQIDEMGIWSQQLSAQDKLDLYNLGNWQTMV